MIVQWDRGELTSNDFIYELGLEGVELNLTALNLTQEDGVTETSNRIIINNSNAIIKWVNSPKILWAPAMETAVYCRTRTRSKGIATATTDCEVMLYELWCGQKANIPHLLVWVALLMLWYWNKTSKFRRSCHRVYVRSLYEDDEAVPLFLSPCQERLLHAW